MVWWLLAGLLMNRQMAAILVVGALLQLSGAVDIVGILMTDLIDPLIDWFTQEVLNNTL